MSSADFDDHLRENPGNSIALEDQMHARGPDPERADRNAHIGRAERQLIGQIIRDGGVQLPLARSLLGPEDFSDAILRRAFVEACEISTVGSRLTSVALADATGQSQGWVDRLVAQAGDGNSCKELSSFIAQAAELRRLDAVAEAIKEAAAKGSPHKAAEILRTAQEQILALGESKSGASPLHNFADMATQGLAEARQKVENRRAGELVEGMSFGFQSLDNATGGAKAGQMIIMGGRPSMGKTTLANNCFLNVAARYTDRAHVFFSLETPVFPYYTRSAASLSGVPMRTINRGEVNAGEMEELMRSTVELQSMRNTWFVDLPRGQMSDVHLHLEQIQARSGLPLGLVVFDHLHAMDLSLGKDKYGRLPTLVKQFKALTSTGCSLMLLAQLSRKLEDRDDKRPRMSDLEGAGVIEQVADDILFVYRPAYYTQDKGCRLLEVIKAKGREGGLGSALMNIDLSTNRVTERKPVVVGGEQEPIPW
ncbi:MAG: replicative DNA helicase [Bradymonadia bacterium]